MEKCRQGRLFAVPLDDWRKITQGSAPVPFEEPELPLASDIPDHSLIWAELIQSQQFTSSEEPLTEHVGAGHIYRTDPSYPILRIHG